MRARPGIAAVLASGVLAAAAVAGCGAGGEREAASSRGTGRDGDASAQISKLPRTVAPPRTQPVPAAVQDELAAGGVALSDLAGRAAIEPRTVRFASDATLTGVTWSHWGADGAEGRGTMRVLSCNPNCADGGVRREHASIELSAPSVCPDGRFFSASRVIPDAGPVPATYLRAPC